MRDFWLWTEGRTVPESLRDLDDVASLTGEYDEEAVEDRRRSPWMRPLGMTRDEAYDYDILGAEL